MSIALQYSLIFHDSPVIRHLASAGIVLEFHNVEKGHSWNNITLIGIYSLQLYMYIGKKVTFLLIVATFLIIRQS